MGGATVRWVDPVVDLLRLLGVVEEVDRTDDATTEEELGEAGGMLVEGAPFFFSGFMATLPFPCRGTTAGTFATVFFAPRRRESFSSPSSIFRSDSNLEGLANGRELSNAS